MANQPIGGYYRKAYQDFSGGLNNFQNPLIIKENEFASLSNALVNNTGILEATTGYTTDGSPWSNTANDWIRMAIEFKRGTTVDNLVVAAHDDNNANTTYTVDLKQTSGDGNYAYIGHTDGTASFTSGNTAVTGSGTTWTKNLKSGDKIKANADADSAYVEIQSVNSDTSITLKSNYSATHASAAYTARIILNKSCIPNAAVFNNYLIITNGSETPMYWDNTTLKLIQNSTTGSVPTGQFITTYKNRVFLANTGGAPSRIYWSYAFDQTTWDQTAEEDIFPADNGSICAIKPFADCLVVFKDNGKIYYVQGSFDQDVVGAPSYIGQIDTPDNMGVIAGYTVVLHDDGRIYFLAQTGVYAMDSSFRFEKISWPINNDVLSVVLRSGATQQKFYQWATQSQFNQGTLTGVNALSGGGISNFFDSYTLNSYTVGNAAYPAVTLGSDNTVHCAYVDSSYNVHYRSIDTAGTVSDTILYTASGNINGSQVYEVAIAVTGTTVGVAVTTSVTGVVFYERVGGTWSAMVTAYDNVANNDTQGYALSMTYSGTDPRIVCSNTTGLGNSAFKYVKRSAGVFSSSNIATGIQTSGQSFPSPAFGGITISGSNVGAVYFDSGGVGTLRGFLSTNDGSSWTVYTAKTGVSTANGCSFNATTQLCSSYVDSATTKLNKYNFVTPSSTVLDNSTGAWANGYIFYSSQDYAYYQLSTTTEKFLFSSSISSSAQGTTSAIGSTQPRCQTFFNNGAVFVSVVPSTSTNQYLIRRVSFVATWVSPEQNDSTLSQWGNFVVTGETLNSGTISYQIAVNNVSGLPAPSTILNNQLISSDVTKVYVQATVTMTLGGFSAPSISLVTLNYTGQGVGAAVPTACVFNNELYIAVASTGQTQNSYCLFLDRNKAWGQKPFPVSFMSRYKYNLFGGSSTNGDVYQLNNGYTLNGSPISVTATSKEDLLGSLELVKDVYKVYVIYQIQSSGTLTFSYRLDNFATSGGSSWTDTTIDQTKDGIAEVPVGNTCKSIQFKVSSSANGTNIGVVGWVILYGYLDLR